MSSPSLIRSDRPAWRLEPRTKIRCRTPSRLDGEIGSKNREFGKNRSTPSSTGTKKSFGEIQVRCGSPEPLLCQAPDDVGKCIPERIPSFMGRSAAVFSRNLGTPDAVPRSPGTRAVHRHQGGVCAVPFFGDCRPLGAPRIASAARRQIRKGRAGGRMRNKNGICCDAERRTRGEPGRGAGTRGAAWGGICEKRRSRRGGFAVFRTRIG